MRTKKNNSTLFYGQKKKKHMQICIKPINDFKKYYNGPFVNKKKIEYVDDDDDQVKKNMMI